ncbi:MAG TPA: hypothetical protein HPP66_00630 [Planctomycetes bacterium]|nr:hypothetical protein [Planctomycetota bacterium]
MKRIEILKIFVLVLGLIVCPAELTRAAPMGTVFTYQGRLLDADDAADSLYDFEFRLFDDPCTGIQQGGTIDVNDLDVIDGYFTVELDFGGVFNGNAHWLEIAVRPGESIDANDFAILIPRQELTPTPYAIYAKASAPDNDWWLVLNDMYSIPLGNVGIGTANPAYKLDVAGDIRATGSIYGTIAGTVANADKLDGCHESSFFQLSENEIVTGRPAFNGGTSGSSPPFYVDSSYVVSGLNADYLDGLHSSSFATSGHNHNTLYYTQAESDARFVNVTGDSMTGTLNVNGTVYTTHDSSFYAAYFNNAGTGDGIRASSNATAENYAAVYAQNYGTGSGIYASSTGGYAGFFKGDVKVDGNLKVYDGFNLVLELGTGLDYAEGFDVSESTKIDAGSVLIIDADNPGKLALSNKPYDTKVAGIVAGANGIGSGVRLGAGQFDYDVALAGRIYCKVDATEAGVEPGDLLTTCATPGYAMKAADYARAQGAILGKAMESLEKGQKGQILVLVTLQ